jgi:uncharacterized membrane protein YcaP (DUF421 family)
MWFDSWASVARVLASGLATYVLLIVLLRTSGKRTLSKLNAFDLVVTVAMGSTLSGALLSPDVTVAKGAAAFLVLVLGQLLVARLSVLSGRFARLVRSEPRLVLRDGRFLDEALRQERLTRSEVIAAIRQAGLRRIEDAGAVVLETDGSFSVLAAGDAPPTVLDGVKQ